MNKNADHLEAEIDAVAADSAADETDVAAVDTEAAEAVTAADAIEAEIDAVAAEAAAVTDQDTKLPNVLSLEIFPFFAFL